MKDLRRILVAVPAAMLAFFILAAFMTRGSMQHLPARRTPALGGASNDLVDQRPWQTVIALEPLAISAEEQSFAREAARLADHEVDQAFALALRQASVETRVLHGEALVLEQKVATLQAAVKTDQAQVQALADAARKAGTESTPGDDLDVARAQLGLDEDELADAMQDLAQATGDTRAEVQQELTAHQAAMKKHDAQTAANGETAVISARRYRTLYGRIEAWFDQRSRAELIGQAEQEARADVRTLGAQHAVMDKTSQQMTATSQTTQAGPLVGAAKVKMLQTMATQRSMMSILDDQVQCEQQLAEIYRRWQAQVWTQHKIVDHLLMLSFALVAFIVLAAMLATWAVRALVNRLTADKRRVHTLQTILDVGIQVVGLLLVLLVVFGPPDQMPTILGLATAGLTVVFQDFIVAFCGWFVLMGRHGIRVGDWVEIDSVGGEVLEIGLFRTSLLETGNWTSHGHPTGRRVTFLNGFAIRGQYFNFSTSGQWMWDEITLNIPGASNSPETIEKLRALVVKATEQDVDQAEHEWQRVVRQNSLSQFSAQPTLDMRPAASGVDVIVRYVTRAGDRFDLRNKLYQSMVDLLQEASVVEAK